MGKVITPSRLLDGMFLVLRSDTTTVECGHITNERAFSEWDGKSLRIVVDPFQIGVIPGVVHELLHFVLSDIIEDNFNKELEEAVINKLEEVLYFRIEHFPSVYEKWYTLVAEKLNQEEDHE